ncbi:lactoylglutathione lyase [Enterococcus florum]|uniref:Lactoylglutathione lyase n=1 Tax=Enterococcus florum TaxID=2480627 RepID=A0A4P5PF85_9ENTE|nr:VOC family protein [Enterococcus florum]GCF95404.1 lactoylglutathione lyase [Enterococcus florum]
MRLEHVAMYVRDLEKMREFFETYFEATSNERYHNTKTGLMTYFLTFGDGARLELMTRPEVGQSEPDLYQAGLIHIAFSVGSKEKVDALTEQLISDGYHVLSGPRTTGDGYYESAVRIAEGIQIEITE